eukprot:scaffold52590_cov23-Cyclotella_meneghiniana.AAC.2
MNPNSEGDAFDSLAKLLNNKDIPDDEALLLGKALLKMHPNAVREADRLFGLTLLHFAAVRRGPELCKLLIEMNPDLVRTASNIGVLPVCISCHNVNVETTKYFLNLYPESINIADSEGFCPLNHFIFYHRGKDRDTERDLELLRLLLRYDRGAVSKPTTYRGDLPLHLACRGKGFSLDCVKSIYNSYPEAILTRNKYRNTPLDFARFESPDISSCLQIQRGYVDQADRQLSIHRALQSANILTGTLKLMVAANPSSVTVADTRGNLPIHIACRVGNLDAVKFLMGIDEDSLMTRNGRGNLPLHLACLCCQCEIIPCILEQSAYGVTLQNSEKQTPIELLLYEAECDRNSWVYVEAIRCLFQVNPVDILKSLVKSKSVDAHKD